MRKLMVLLSLGQLLLAQGQTFNRRYDPFGQHYAQVAWSIDGNGEEGFAVTTVTYYDDSVYLYTTAALIRLDSQGEVLSESKMLYGMSSVYPGWANSAQRVRDGGIAIGGSTYPPSEIQNAAIIRYAANGDSLWLREYGDGTNSWIGRQVKQTKDGGYLLCGELYSGVSFDSFLIRTDSSGSEQWQRTYGSDQHWEFALSVDTTSDDGYFVGGQYRVTQNNKNLWVYRVDADGDSLWSKQWGSIYDEPNAHLTTLANGNPIIASAWGYAPQFAVTRLYMAELDQEDGHLIWERQYGPITTTTLFAAKEVRPGEGAIAAGTYYEPDTINYIKGVLLRTAANGDSLWMRTYFYYDSLINDGAGEFKDVVPTNDGGFIACGVALGCYFGDCPPDLEQDAWVVRVDSMGCIIPGCDDFSMAITEQVTNLWDALSVYPNPASGNTTVKVTLPNGSPYARELRLRLVSAQGQEVLVQKAAQGENALDVGKLAGGLYYLHITSGSRWLSGTKLMVE